MICNFIRGFSKIFNNNDHNSSNDFGGETDDLKQETKSDSKNNMIATITVLLMVSSITYKVFKHKRQPSDETRNEQSQASAQDGATEQPQPRNNRRNQANASLSSTATHGNPPEDFDDVYHGDTEDDSDVDEFGIPIRSSGGVSSEFNSLLGNVDSSFWSGR